MATTYVNRTLSQIHNLIQTSGLHFMINSTPFSSYITIRKKLVNVEQIPHTDATSLIEPHHDDRADLKDMLATLKSRNDSLEEDLAHADEDAKVVDNKTNEIVTRLHSKLDNLETRNYSLENELAARDSKIVALEKEMKVKEEIIQNINSGFNQKVYDLKDKLECLEQEKKEAIKKEKKATKRKRQKARKEESKHEESKTDEPHENNNLKKETKIYSYPCPFCVFVAKTESEIEEHAVDVHEQFAEITRKFNEHNSESIKMLEDVARIDWILTPEEISHFGVDWKIHLEILKILDLGGN